MEEEIARNIDITRNKVSDFMDLQVILKEKEKSENKRIMDLEQENIRINEELKSTLKEYEELKHKCINYEELKLKIEKQLMDSEVRFAEEIAKTEEHHRQSLEKWKKDEKELVRLSKENEVNQHKKLAEAHEQILEKKLEIEKLQKKIDDLGQNLENGKKSLEELLSKNVKLAECMEKTMEEKKEYLNQVKMMTEAKEIAEKSTSFLSNEVVALKQQLESVIEASECEHNRLLAEMKAEKSKLQAELREADAEKTKLAKEVTLNVEDLAKLRVQHEERSRNAYEGKLVTDELHKAKFEFSQLTEHLRKSEDVFKRQINDITDMSLQQSKQISQLKDNNEMLKSEKEALQQENSRLLSHIEELSASMTSKSETKNGTDERTITGKKIVKPDGKNEEIKTNEADQMELGEKMMESQEEVLRLWLSQLDTDGISKESKQNLKLFIELEEYWKEKNFRLAEQIEDLTLHLEASKKVTQNEELLSLTKEIEFLHSIIADQQKKAKNLEEKIDILTNSPIGLTGDSPYKSLVENKGKRRLYCDICEEFDRHETEDCPTQDLENSESSKHSHFKGCKKTNPPPREYCDHCEEFDHDVSNCPRKAKKREYTF